MHWGSERELRCFSFPSSSSVLHLAMQPAPDPSCLSPEADKIKKKLFGFWKTSNSKKGHFREAVTAAFFRVSYIYKSGCSFKIIAWLTFNPRVSITGESILVLFFVSSCKKKGSTENYSRKPFFVLDRKKKEHLKKKSSRKEHILRNTEYFPKFFFFIFNFLKTWCVI